MNISDILQPKPTEWHERRRQGIGGSDAFKIMAGEWHVLWLEKIGQKEPEDLSHILPVVLGGFTEPLNLAWLQREAGIEVDVSDRYAVHPKYNFIRCELDARAGGNIVECKHVNAWAKENEVVNKYYAQCQHQMACSGADICYLSIFFGTFKYEFFEIGRDDEYIANLIDREIEFWGYVERNEPPPDMPSEAVVIALDDMREVEMAGNEWPVHAAAWLENKAAAKSFKAAENDIKALVEADVKLAFGAGVQVKRSKNGALRISEMN